MRRVISLVALVALAMGLGALACGGPDKPPMTPDGENPLPPDGTTPEAGTPAPPSSAK